MSEPATRDRFRGSLLGLAAGDALGTTLEFKRPGTFQAIDDMIGGGPFNLEPGQWTDDTSMALCLAASLIERGEFDPMDQMRRYVRWRDEGYLSSTGTCFDIGNTIARALSRFMESDEPFAGSSDPYSAGNGSLMRLAPVPMYFAGDVSQAIRRSADSSRTTHGAEEAVDGCRYFSGLLVGALRGVDKKTLLSARYCPAEGHWERSPLAEKVADVADGSFKHREPPAIRGTGYVVESMEAALWAFHKSEDFREGLFWLQTSETTPTPPLQSTGRSPAPLMEPKQSRWNGETCSRWRRRSRQWPTASMTTLGSPCPLRCTSAIRHDRRGH